MQAEQVVFLVVYSRRPYNKLSSPILHILSTLMPGIGLVGEEQVTREIGTLFDSERWWRDQYREIENHGNRLRLRYHPECEPPWERSGDFEWVPGFTRRDRNQCIPLYAVLELSHAYDQELMVIPFLPRNRPILLPPPSARDEMDPTLSCWLRNMNKLSSLIDRLEELASSAPEKHRSQLSRKVATLRATFKKQQERCINFLQLSEEYADKYLRDISGEIRQQTSFLDMLEKRLDMAKTLRQQAVDLRRSYESGTVATMKDVRTTGKTPFCCL